MLYRDFVFINRRLAKTRFKRNLVLFCGVNFDGRTIIYGVSLIKDDTQENYQFAINAFLSSIDYNNPKTIIIERSSALRNALEACFDCQKVKILYCYHHLYKSLKFQIRQIIYGGHFSDRTKNIMNRISKLPKVDFYHKLQKELEDCK